MRRTLAVGVLVMAALALALASAEPADAAGECDGLDVCISRPGPFVAVPSAPSGRTTTVVYRLTCPPRSIVGGLDAVLGDRALDVVFLGTLGSPVNPGITTARSVDFVATHARTGTTYFRPFIGCIPTSGGGGRETTAAAPRPPVRRVRAQRLGVGPAQTVRHACRAGERLVGSSHAVAFWTRRAPALDALTGVAASRRQLAARIDVRARRGVAVPVRDRVEVQVHAICARGPA